MKEQPRFEDIKAAFEARPRHGGTELKEADYKHRLVAEVNRLPGHHASRVEDKYVPGRLDLIFKLPGREAFWAEGKVIKNNVFGPTPIQFAEGVKWIEAGMRVILIGWHYGAIYLSPWTLQADRRNCLGNEGFDHVKTLMEFTR